MRATAVSRTKRPYICVEERSVAGRKLRYLDGRCPHGLALKPLSVSRPLPLLFRHRHVPNLHLGVGCLLDHRLKRPAHKLAKSLHLLDLHRELPRVLALLPKHLLGDILLLDAVCQALIALSQLVLQLGSEHFALHAVVAPLSSLQALHHHTKLFLELYRHAACTLCLLSRAPQLRLQAVCLGSVRLLGASHLGTLPLPPCLILFKSPNPTPQLSSLVRRSLCVMRHANRVALEIIRPIVLKHRKKLAEAWPRHGVVREAAKQDLPHVGGECVGNGWDLEGCRDLVADG
mmetsp:Transcript_32001/g.80570  ORF Transcript_32001/g.80570 Transcript_32001/m.80570 type:complete len:289 (+) Transcript_32001:478-1344(+)